MRSFSGILAFAAANERKLGAALFAFGFLTDFLTFGLLPVGVVIWLFAGYLALALVSALGAYAFATVPESASFMRRAAKVAFPLALQYAFGGLLSGLTVFYTAHSVVAASWPFLFFLALVYIGNEYFRMHKHLLVFQATLLFFTLYAVSVFALPVFMGILGAPVFIGSTVLALAVFAAFLFALSRIDRPRLIKERRLIGTAVAGIVVVVSGCYFTGVIPPIPLAMRHGAVYQELVKVPGGYRALGEAPQAWWNPFPSKVRLAEGAPLYAYSAVAAPVAFASTVVHRWERKVEGKGWVTESRIAFPITGGREDGYRGYSVKDALAPGAWRVSVETPDGLVIGRIRFDIENAGSAPALIETTL